MVLQTEINLHQIRIIENYIDIDIQNPAVLCQNKVLKNISIFLFYLSQ